MSHKTEHGIQNKDEIINFTDRPLLRDFLHIS